MNVKMVHIHAAKVKNVEIVPVRTLSYDKKKSSKLIHTGSYRCINNNCPDGYVRDDYGRCIDVDECAKGEHNCPGIFVNYLLILIS